MSCSHSCPKQAAVKPLQQLSASPAAPWQQHEMQHSSSSGSWGLVLARGLHKQAGQGAVLATQFATDNSLCPCSDGGFQPCRVVGASGAWRSPTKTVQDRLGWDEQKQQRVRSIYTLSSSTKSTFSPSSVHKTLESTWGASPGCCGNMTHNSETSCSLFRILLVPVSFFLNMWRFVKTVTTSFQLTESTPQSSLSATWRSLPMLLYPLI